MLIFGGWHLFRRSGVVTGGGNSFTFIQSNSDSHSLAVNTATDTVCDTGTDTYTLNMLGTETYGSGGTVSGGSDSFTWAQTATDALGLTEDGGGTTLGAYTLYQITESDQLYQNFSDVGNDILGASDSILGGCDTYTWGTSRDVDTSVVDSGDSATPYYIQGHAWDDVNLAETGSSTLTTDAHIHATITYTYTENSGSTSTVSQSYSDSVHTGTASDSYSVSDSGTITISDTTTTSLDSFSVQDNHSISGSLSYSATNSTSTVAWTDKGMDTDTMNAQGTKSTGGDVYSFTDSESSTDNFALNKQVQNQQSGGATDTTSMTTSMSGNTSTSPSGSSFSYGQLTQNSNSVGEAGSVTYSGVVTPFTQSQATTTTVQLSVSGPAVSTVTVESVTTSTSTGSNDGANFTELENAGQGYSAGTRVAAQIGSSPMDSAEHQGTSPGSVDTSSGLLSALGGQAVHAMSFGGAEIMPAVNSAGNAVGLEESYQQGSTPVNWVSHPAASEKVPAAKIG